MHDEETPSLTNASQEINQFDILNINLQASSEELLNTETDDKSFIFDQNRSLSLNSNDELAFQVESVSQDFNAKIYGGITDCPTLKVMADMIGHNGYYPCFYCYMKREHVRLAAKRQYQYELLVNHLTVKSLNTNSRKAQLNKKNVFGHLGTSILDEVVDVPLPHS
ncbi:unnamed protein product [Rotaria sp. Silwood2]|nr:unnamed protein product [Rotaria sp. Silwood2]CAF3091636.1 unnamed protein product [Rotaria sp. Silwood2]CAF3208397.1 unnamed protein product [Rotaria sp. Silwood2]CAF3367248.1 unnamed protein product [Rotaria sp. Silwood2]CAF4118221.1 unnamed protein product [Rotaria sp. Silwood2]